MKRASSALPNSGKADKARKVEVVCTQYKATCIRQSLGKSGKISRKFHFLDFS